MKRESVVICVPTYRRPSQLAALLSSLVDMQSGIDWRLVVVDNDPAGSARAYVESLQLKNMTYVVERKAGLAAVRNRCLEMLRVTDTALAFIDDDEYVSKNWLIELVRTARAYGANVVGGPVVSVLPPNAPRWLRRTALLQRPTRPTGCSEGTPFTGNCLVSTELLVENGIRFSEEFSTTGGEDREFFDRLLSWDGVNFAWSAEAVVYEPIVAERLKIAWVIRRAIRTGNVMGRLRLAHDNQVRVWCGGLLRTLTGTAGFVILYWIHPHLAGRALLGAGQGVGMMGAATGRFVREYARGE